MASTLFSCGKKTDKQDTRGVFQRRILQKPANMWHGTRVNKTEEQWAAMKGFSGTVLGQ